MLPGSLTRSPPYDMRARQRRAGNSFNFSANVSMYPERSAPPSEVFLSHSAKDLAFTRRLSEVLVRHGVKTFFSEEPIRGAEDWHDEIGAALRRHDDFAELFLALQALVRGMDLR